MKVKDVMYSSVVSVEENWPIKQVARLIFTAGSYNFPVVNNNKLVGFITEEDISTGMFGSSQGKDYDKASLLKVLEKPVKDLMVKNVISVSPETNLIDAQFLMYKNNFAQLPVVNEKSELVGLLTRPSIFRHVLEEEIPQLEQDQYTSFISENYDNMIEWDKRFDLEFPTLFRIFKRENVEKVLDVGVWTGEYTINLAKEGIDVVGIDHVPLMIKICNDKRAKLPETVKKRVEFKKTDYKDLDKLFSDGSFDAAVCMGGSLPYLPVNPISVMKSVKKLIRKDGILVLQLLNLERVIEKKKRVLYFKIKEANKPNGLEELQLEFFDKKNDKTLIQNILTFTSDGERWVYRGINSIEIAYIKNSDVFPLLEKAGFKDITITGNKGEEEGEYGHMSLVKPFDPQTSEWMTVFAKA